MRVFVAAIATTFVSLSSRIVFPLSSFVHIDFFCFLAGLIDRQNIKSSGSRVGSGRDGFPDLWREIRPLRLSPPLPGIPADIASSHLLLWFPRDEIVVFLG
jgi:hypothetical protein